jgi:hypothetical protein
MHRGRPPRAADEEERVTQTAALLIFFRTIASFSYVGLPPDKSSQRSAFIDVAPNFGGGIGVSMAQTIPRHPPRLADRKPLYVARRAIFSVGTKARSVWVMKAVRTGFVSARRGERNELSAGSSHD